MLFFPGDWLATSARRTFGAEEDTISIRVLLGSRENGAKVTSSAGRNILPYQRLTKLGTEMAKSQGPENIGPENAVSGF